MNRLISLLAAALLLGGGTAAGQDVHRMFELKETSADPDAAQALALRLVEYAQTYASASADYYYVGDYRKLVRTAFQLAPEDPVVATAHARIRAGQVPDPPKRKAGQEEVMAALLDHVSLARAGQKRDDRLLATILCSVGLAIDPTNETCLLETQKPGRNLDGLWEAVLSVYRRTIADGTVSSIQGLVVSSSGAAQVGQTSRIVLTYRARSIPLLEVRLLREQGPMMNVSADEAIRYWNRVRKHVPLPHGSIEISFEDKFSQKEGPSAGAAYAVLLRSFSDPFEIDPAVAMTGDVSVEGRVLPVGGVYAKIRGAVLGGCSRVGIPGANESDLMDGIVVNGWSTLADIEVIGMDSIDGAIALARTDRDAKARGVSSDFATLKPLIAQKARGSSDPALADSIQKLVDSVLAANPRHLSGKVIQMWNRGRLPVRLTLASSLDAAHEILVGYLVVIRRADQPSFNDIVHETRTANIAGAIDKMRALLPKMHVDAQKPADKLEQCCLSIQRFIYLRGDVEKKQKRVEELDKTIKDLRSRIERAQADRRPVEEINALIKRHNQAVMDQREAVDRYNKEVEDRKKFLVKAVEHYNDFVIQVRTMVQDPKLLEKLKYGK